jgi:hypothetical protein
MKPFSRRNFLKGAAAAPIAARTAAASIAAQIEAAAGVRSVGSMAYGIGIPTPPMVGPAGASTPYDEDGRLSKLLDLVRWGIPAWKKRQYQRYARYNRTLDPDIASLRSISTGYKLRMQWRRDVVRMEVEEIEDLHNQRDRSGWLRRFGVDYW